MRNFRRMKAAQRIQSFPNARRTGNPESYSGNQLIFEAEFRRPYNVARTELDPNG